jgi:hypothetical protein
MEARLKETEGKLAAGFARVREAGAGSVEKLVPLLGELRYFKRSPTR